MLTSKHSLASATTGEADHRSLQIVISILVVTNTVGAITGWLYLDASTRYQKGNVATACRPSRTFFDPSRNPRTRITEFDETRMDPLRLEPMGKKTIAW